MSNILPEDAYPEEITPERRKEVDRLMEELLPLLPTAPGRYHDGDGDLWIKNEDGSWTDKFGETKSVEYSPVLTLFGPWSNASYEYGL